MDERPSSNVTKIGRQKLIDVLLIEADYNLLPKPLVNRCLIPQAESLRIIPEEEFGILLENLAVEIVVCRKLYWDWLRHIFRPGGLLSFNAAQFYDNIAHLHSFLASKIWVITLLAVRTLILAIQLITFYLRMGHEDSKKSHGGTRDNPFHGACQTNGSGPGLWILVCYFLIQYLRQ